MRTTFFSHLRCSQCSRTYDPQSIQTVCSHCGRTLLAEYDLLTARKQLDREAVAARQRSLWRYRELLPVFDDASIISLGEGWTPLIHARNLGGELGVSNLFIKEEGLNPTGSFKARGLCLAVSKAKELGVREMAMPSAGNAGGALAAYATKAGIGAPVFVPKDTPIANIKELTLF